LVFQEIGFGSPESGSGRTTQEQVGIKSPSAVMPMAFRKGFKKRAKLPENATKDYTGPAPNTNDPQDG